MVNTKRKLVVVNEHTLGYIIPELPNYYSILRASILKGAPFDMAENSKLIGSKDVIRLASEKDFDEFRCVFKGYDNDRFHEYEYAKDGEVISVFTTAHKSFACSKVLQLMDKDYSYQKALAAVMNEDDAINKNSLEKELNLYI